MSCQACRESAAVEKSEVRGGCQLLYKSKITLPFMTFVRNMTSDLSSTTGGRKSAWRRIVSTMSASLSTRDTIQVVVHVFRMQLDQCLARVSSNIKKRVCQLIAAMIVCILSCMLPMPALHTRHRADFLPPTSCTCERRGTNCSCRHKIL